MIDKSRSILKIADFGLGKDYKNRDFLMTACGSPCYAPPEMFQNRKYNPEKVDVWALGVIMYAMLLGFLPFDDKDSRKILTNMMDYKIRFPNNFTSDLTDLLKKMINLNPAERITLKEIEGHPWIIQML